MANLIYIEISKLLAVMKNELLAVTSSTSEYATRSLFDIQRSNQVFLYSNK